MILGYPAYFDKFSCIAAQCPDSCCKDWDVAVDEASARSYLQLPGALGDALRAHLSQEDGDYYFTIVQGRCPFWQADGLCRIQKEQGHQALCQTCRDFPRLTHDYGDFVERGLCMSCPEAARLIFENTPGPWLRQEVPGGEPPEYDGQDMEILLETRDTMISLLCNGDYSVREALALGLLYGYHAQAMLDGESVAAFDPAWELEMGRSLAKRAPKTLLTEFYQKLEILTDAWARRLARPQGGNCFAEDLRAMAVYGIERYWLQAISDFDLVGRAKMVMAGCLLVQHLGGPVVETAQLYAKEIENSSENVDAILDGAYESPALTDDKLLGWLLL